MSTSFNQMSGSTRASSSGSNNNNNFTLAMEGGHMFDKVLTPSDVGKLNRLVVPKVHAEAYFPLEDNKNDATLDFLDPTGKTWRFRYSYWNSSQSYVMTKGWNRFIKDKTLQHGDIVSFRRCFVPDDNDPEKHRTIMLIDWKKKSDIQLGNSRPYPIYGSQASSLLLLPMGGYYPTTGYPIPHYRSFQPLYDNQFQERELFGNGYGRFVNGGHYYGGVRNPTLEVGRETSLDYNHLGRSEPLVFASFPVFPRGRVAPSGQPLQAREGVAPTKKLRLFGVDMEESSSSGETMGYSFASPHGEMGASSSLVMQLSDEEEYKRKGKSFIY